jgi:hypothetical protein
MVIALLLCACAGGPVAPQWQTQSQSALEEFKQHYLEGNTPAAARAFARARSAVAATGRPELVARVELYRCAIGVAALDLEACTEFEALRGETSAEDRSYGDFVTGTLKDSQAVALLPDPYREIASASNDAARDKALARIADPVSRLVAAGVLFRKSQLTPTGVSTAVDMASAQGYRRPLLAYLNVQEKQAQSAGDTAAAEAIRKRIEFVYQSLPQRAREQVR